jgi:hypothetical protein
MRLFFDFLRWPRGDYTLRDRARRGSMGRGEPSTDARADLHHVAQRNATTPREMRPEHLALDELHRKKAIAVVLPDVERAGDVLVDDTARELHLASKALEHRWRRGELLAEDLQRDRLVELAVARAIDRAHCARPEQLEDLVALRDRVAVAIFVTRRVRHRRSW